MAVGHANTGVVTAAETTAVNLRLNIQAMARVPVPPQITGHTKFGIGAADGAALNAIAAIGGVNNNSICTQHVPFQLTFKSDHFEGTGKAGERGLLGTTAEDQKGFKMQYSQIKCTA
jgi:hypothetical protein